MRRTVDVFAMLAQDPASAARYGEVNRADALAVAGDIAAAVEILDTVAASPAIRRAPLLAAGYRLVRGAIAEAQGDLQRAEDEMTGAVEIFESRWDRSAHSEALEKLGKIQVLRGRNSEAYRTFTRALQVGGGRMYRLSRVRTELYLTNIAWDTGDKEAAVGHAMATRDLARRWDCHAQHGMACDVLAFAAVDGERLDEASAWVAEAGQAFERGAASSPVRLRHEMALALVADARGDQRGALEHYVRMMTYVAELRAGWGWRHAQAHFVDLYSVHEAAAFRIADHLHQRGDRDAVTGIAALLDLGSRTALRRMLRGEILDEEPADLGGTELQDIVQVLGGIAAREGAILGDAVAPTSVPVLTTGPGAGAADPVSPYERLETLVSLRFRHSMEPSADACTQDVRPSAVRWDTHVLQMRILSDGESVQLAGLWTTPQGRREPYLHEVTAAQAKLLEDVTGNPGALTGAGQATAPPPAAGTPAPQLPEGVRADAPRWETTPRYLHLISHRTTAWAELAEILLPADLLTLLRGVDPDGVVPKLLLVPDQFLWRLPWAALQVVPGDPDGYLVDRVVPATLPSLSLLGETDEPAPHGPRRAVAYLAGVNPGGIEIERRALAEAYGSDLTATDEPAAFLSAFAADGPRPAVAMATVHGNDRPGLAHALSLARGVALSAAQMLTLRFPPILMINACLSAELDRRRGTDPLGIPTVALCRGARTVIGGIFPLPDGEAGNPAWSHSTAAVLALLYPLIAGGVAPSSALRAAQRQWRRERGWTPPLLWAGLVSITTRLDDPDRAG